MQCREGGPSYFWVTVHDYLYQENYLTASTLQPSSSEPVRTRISERRANIISSLSKTENRFPSSSTWATYTQLQSGLFIWFNWYTSGYKTSFYLVLVTNITIFWVLLHDGIHIEHTTNFFYSCNPTLLLCLRSCLTIWLTHRVILQNILLMSNMCETHSIILFYTNETIVQLHCTKNV